LLIVKACGTYSYQSVLKGQVSDYGLKGWVSNSEGSVGILSLWRLGSAQPSARRIRSSFTGSKDNRSLKLTVHLCPIPDHLVVVYLATLSIASIGFLNNESKWTWREAVVA